MSQYLSEAFKKLDILNEDTFTINDNGLEDFVKFEEEDEFEDSIDVIDPEATTIDELQDSYVGKVILDCCVCHSKIYKDVEDVVVEDDIANANEECPFCYTTDGFKVVGQVAAFGETEEAETEEKEEIEVEEKDETETEKTDDKIEEGLFGIKTKKEKEKEAKAKAQKEAQKQRDKELADQEERARQQSVADSWARSDKAKRDAQAEYNRSRSNTSGSSVSNTGKAGVYYSGGDYYSESYKDTHMIMGEDGSEVYTDEDLRKIWDDNHTSDPSMKGYKSFDDWKADTVSQMEELNESKSINEDINNITLDTDDSHMEVNTDENGKVTITTEPVETSIATEEIIQPLEPEVQNEIDSNVADGGEIEIDMDEFDEESFDELGEGYLKKVYENVNSFKTSNVSFIKNKLILEGVIKFNSGKSKKTNFIFESREATKTGKVRFIGENKEIARGKKSFTVTGKINDKKFLSESLNYNYGVKGIDGKAHRLYGTVRTKKEVK